MKIAPLVSLLALALCASCTSNPPGYDPLAAPATDPLAAPGADPLAAAGATPPPAPGANLPPAPRANLPPAPRANLPPAPRTNLPAAPGANPPAASGFDPLSLPPPVLDTTASPTEQLASQCKAALNAKDYAGAQTAAAGALRLDPQYEEVWVAYGMASLRLGQEERARQSYARALAVHQARELKSKPDASQVYEEIYLLLLLGRTFDAESLLNRACAAFPNDRPLSTLSALFPEFKQSWQPWAVKSP
jgi:hypothetical protein